MPLNTNYIKQNLLETEIAKFIEGKLQEPIKVLLLLSGGSNIDIETRIMRLIDTELTANLIIGLIDERFGPFNHSDSNFRLLIDSGFNPKKAKLIKVIENSNYDLTQTSDQYNNSISKLFKENLFSIGILGIGVDGHLAGILPNSPIINSNKIVDSYDSNDFQRISLTFKGLKLINQIFVVTQGQIKDKIIKEISVNQKNNINEIPANILKKLNSIKIYNIN